MRGKNMKSIPLQVLHPQRRLLVLECYRARDGKGYHDSIPFLPTAPALLHGHTCHGRLECDLIVHPTPPGP